MSTPVLHQFLYSHFNEKARWALAHKGIAHTRSSHLPGPHMRAIRKLSGQSQTPVLVTDNAVISGSAAIIDHLERRFPERPLYPADPQEREQALDVQREFDEGVGPATRTTLFAELIQETGYLTRMFARDRGALGRSLYRATLPLAKPLIARGNGVADPENVRRSIELTQATLDRVAEQTRRTGYMVGNAFSVADLTVAALLAPLVRLEHPDMRRPEPLPYRLEAFYTQWEDHPAARWVREQYERHRP